MAANLLYKVGPIIKMTLVVVVAGVGSMQPAVSGPRLMMPPCQGEIESSTTQHPAATHVDTCLHNPQHCLVLSSLPL